MRQGNVAFYVFADALNDNGWRDRSPRSCGASTPTSASSATAASSTSISPGASNFFGAAAATPIELLNQRWSAVYTTPQTYKNQLAFLNATGSYPAHRHALVQEQSLLPRLLAEARRRQHQRRRAVRSRACSRASCASRRTTIRCSASTACRCPTRSQRRDAGLDRSHRDRRRTATAARCRRPARRSCSAAPTTSWSAPASIAAASTSRLRASSASSAPTCSSPAPASSSTSRTVPSARPTSRPATPITGST